MRLNTNLQGMGLSIMMVVFHPQGPRHHASEYQLLGGKQQWGRLLPSCLACRLLIGLWSATVENRMQDEMSLCSNPAGLFLCRFQMINHVWWYFQKVLLFTKKNLKGNLEWNLYTNTCHLFLAWHYDIIKATFTCLALLHAQEWYQLNGCWGEKTNFQFP